MMKHNRFEGSVVPFARRWHVIQEVDLVRLIGEHRRRADLCDRLEDLADTLPALPMGDARERLCRDLEAAVADTEREELLYLEAMLSDGHTNALTTTLLDHIRVRHATDMSSALEVIGELRSLGPVARSPAPELLGYMLRSFFTSCRRAIDFEQLTILALAGHRLTPDARALLTSTLATARAA